jgi:hypothetical protein
MVSCSQWSRSLFGLRSVLRSLQFGCGLFYGRPRCRDEGNFSCHPSVECCAEDRASKEFSAYDPQGTECDLELGYVAIVVLGSQRIRGRPNNGCQDCQNFRCTRHEPITQHEACLKFLLSRGAPPNAPDLCGYTALHHSLIGAPKPAVARILVEHGADVNAQNRYGITPLLIALDINNFEVVEMLLRAGAKLDLKDGEGTSPEALYRTRKPDVVRAVEKHIREKVGDDATLKGDRCSVCKRRGIPLKRCARCRMQMYCSVECQSKCSIHRQVLCVLTGVCAVFLAESDWRTHKSTCTPFDQENVVILKPLYLDLGPPGAQPVSISINGPSPLATGFGSSVHDGKNMIVKIQLPLSGSAGLMIYNEKRTFKCMVNRGNNPTGYERIESIIKKKGVYGVKGYFAAELKSQDVLAVKVVELSDEHRF